MNGDREGWVTLETYSSVGASVVGASVVGVSVVGGASVTLLLPVIGVHFALPLVATLFTQPAPAQPGYDKPEQEPENAGGAGASRRALPSTAVGLRHGWGCVG